VMQRLALRQKGASPDLLVMSATPIPRSLALTLHGDLDLSYLRQRPTGHTAADAVRTHVVTRGEREPAYAAVRRAVSEGRRAYVVCPLVEENPETEARAVSAEAARLSREVFPDLRLEPLTGQTRPEEKARVMRQFAVGDIDVLVATTVIEVGIDVPEATVMIIEDADRFGLAQLHQLRGRVARGAVPGECYLFADPSTPEGHKRVAAMADISDGFELAEFDLKLRGQGELLGERQSGFSEFRLASLSDDADLLESARADATDIVREDPGLGDPRHRCLAMDPWMSDRDAVDRTESG
jgi:ATP-dependent DNA helicase RecG